MDLTASARSWLRILRPCPLACTPLSGLSSHSQGSSAATRPRSARTSSKRTVCSKEQLGGRALRLSDDQRRRLAAKAKRIGLAGRVRHHLRPGHQRRELVPGTKPSRRPGPGSPPFKAQAKAYTHHRLQPDHAPRRGKLGRGAISEQGQ